MRNVCLAAAIYLVIGIAIAGSPNQPEKVLVAKSIPRTTPVPKEFFGLIIHRAHTSTRWPAMPFGSWRLWDSYLKWSDIQPARNVWQFANFDRQVELATQHGVDIIHTLGQTPTWASAAALDKHAYGLGSGSMPKSIEDWRLYVEAIVTRYKGKIHGYEVWNEPKYSECGKCSGFVFFCGTPDDLVRLTEVVHQVIKRTDPKALVMSPGFTDGLHGVKRLDQYLAAGGAKYVEAISFHFYELRPEKAWETYAAIQTVLDKHRLSHLPIWNTEVGYLVQNQEQTLEPEHSQGPFSVVLSPEDAAGYLARVMLVSASGGAARVYWYAWDNKRMGLVGTQDGLPHAAASGYRVVRRWLIGSTIDCSKLTAGIWRCGLDRDGRTASIYWAEDGQFPLLLPGTENKAIEDLSEGRRVVKGGSELYVDRKPILISEDGAPWYAKKN